MRDKLKWWPGAWKSDFWLLVILVLIAGFFIGGRCVGR